MAEAGGSPAAASTGIDQLIDDEVTLRLCSEAVVVSAIFPSLALVVPVAVASLA